MNTFQNLCKLFDIYDKNKEIIDYYNNSPLKKWIKLIPFDNNIIFNEYDNKKYFKKVADVILDNELDSYGKKKRNTYFKFCSVISKTEFEEKKEWLYLITVNNRIVKIGGTRTGLKERCNSYLCGHHTRENKKSGYCSNTNAFVYNTIYFYLILGFSVKLYGYQLPLKEIQENILGEKIKILIQTFHSYESVFLKSYKNKYNNYPILNNNSDPRYK